MDRRRYLDIAGFPQSIVKRAQTVAKQVGPFRAEHPDYRHRRLLRARRERPRAGQVGGRASANAAGAAWTHSASAACRSIAWATKQTISGAKERDKRPVFDALCRDATKRQFDMVMAWSVDRLGRSLKDLVAFLSELHALRIDLFLHQQGLDTGTPAGKAMFQMMGVFAEFERAIIQERVRAGLARARSEGKQLGRPRIAPERHQEGFGDSWQARCARHCETLRCRSGHSAADQPPFRRRRKRGRGVAR